ncbi:ribonuclease H-like domain-containing protein [Tanacetum coccineum]
MRVDNKSAIARMKNPVFHGRSKHIDIRYHFIRECVEKNQIEVKHISGDLQKAGILTKALARIKFAEMRELLGVESILRFSLFTCSRLIETPLGNNIKKLLIVTNILSPFALPVVVVLWGLVRHDITYYNRQVYSLRPLKCIRACDIYGENPTALVYVSFLPHDLFDKALEEDGLEGESMGRGYIIGLDESKKKLLVVIRHGKLSLTRFLLFAYDLEDERWSRVNDLGKKTLFVGQSSSFWIKDTTGVIKSNCIYSTDDDDYLYNTSEDMGIYHLSDKTIEPHGALLPLHFGFNWSKPLS